MPRVYKKTKWHPGYMSKALKPIKAGTKFGSWVVQKQGPNSKPTSVVRLGFPQYWCTCLSCNERSVLVLAAELKIGHSKKCAACGQAAAAKAAGEANTTHGLSAKFPRLLGVLSKIKQRCADPNQYEGITSCDEWVTDPVAGTEQFVKDMLSLNGGAEFMLGFDVDRINPAPGPEYGYRPGNVRWLPSRINKARTSKCNEQVDPTDGEEIYSEAEMCRKHNISWFTYHNRLKRGWSKLKALTTPVQVQKPKNLKITLQGATDNILTGAPVNPITTPKVLTQLTCIHCKGSLLVTRGVDGYLYLEPCACAERSKRRLSAHVSALEDALGAPVAVL